MGGLTHDANPLHCMSPKSCNRIDHLPHSHQFIVGEIALSFQCTKYHRVSANPSSLCKVPKLRRVLLLRFLLSSIRIALESFDATRTWHFKSEFTALREVEYRCAHYQRNQSNVG